MNTVLRTSLSQNDERSVTSVMTCFALSALARISYFHTYFFSDASNRAGLKNGYLRTLTRIIRSTCTVSISKNKSIRHSTRQGNVLWAVDTEYSVRMNIYLVDAHENISPTYSHYQITHTNHTSNLNASFTYLSIFRRNLT